MKVGKKVFVFFGGAASPPGEISLTVKLPVSYEMALTLPYMSPAGHGLWKGGWAALRQSDGDDIDLETIRGWIVQSYRAVATKKLVKQLDAPGVAWRECDAARGRASGSTRSWRRWPIRTAGGWSTCCARGRGRPASWRARRRPRAAGHEPASAHPAPLAAWSRSSILTSMRGCGSTRLRAEAMDRAEGVAGRDRADVGRAARGRSRRTWRDRGLLA